MTAFVIDCRLVVLNGTLINKLSKLPFWMEFVKPFHKQDSTGLWCPNFKPYHEVPVFKSC